MNKKIIWGIIIAVMIMIGVGVVYSLSHKEQALNCCHGEQYEQYPVSEWSTYKNDEVGYEIKYPKNWKADNIYSGYSDTTDIILYRPNEIKGDNDVPVEYVSIKLLKSNCEATSSWKESYSEIFEKTKQFEKNTCLNKDLMIKEYALSENGKQLLEKISATLKFSSPSVISTTTQSSIKVLSPNGGEKINLDQNYVIKWKNTDTENGGSIYISPKGKDMDKSLVVDRFALKAQSYAWKAGEVFNSDFKTRVKVASGEYKIGVCLTRYVNNKSVEECDWSDSYFTITTPANSETITVTVPNGIYKTNSPTIQFTWKSNYSTKKPQATLWPSQEPANDGNPTPEGYYKNLTPGSFGGTDNLKINATISAGTNYKIYVCDTGITRVNGDVLSNLCGASQEFTITN